MSEAHHRETDVRLSEAPLERVPGELLAIAVSSDSRARSAQLARFERAAGGRLRDELARRRFKGAEGTSVLLPGTGRLVGRSVLVVGVGATAASADALRRAADQLVARARDVRARSAAIVVATAAADEPDVIAALAEGTRLAGYRFDLYRHDAERVPLARLTIAGVSAPRERSRIEALRRALVLADATNRARTWINLPASDLTPTRFADEARDAAAAVGLDVEVDGPDEIERLGMQALLAVGRGSVQEPRLIRLTYRPAGDASAAPRIALVGKGITFDSGGLSLKRGDGMEHMKRDMAGGAAVVGAMLAIAALEPHVEVRAYVPATENMPSGSAVKPGDIVRTVGGKTVEILNTDAEGRLILADALGLAVAQCPDAIVDVATLTAAVRVALGNRVGGIMGNDPGLVAALIAAGRLSGERLWELPLVRAYREDLDSPVADLRNVAVDGGGGAIHAGLFLEEFVGARPWAHLDIAGVAFTDRDLPCTPRGGVGFGVRLLARYASDVAPVATESARTANTRNRPRPAR